MLGEEVTRVLQTRVLLKRQLQPPDALLDPQLSNCKVLDKMGYFGMPNYNTMEEIWKDATKNATVEMTKETLEQTRTPIRAAVSPQKSSRTRSRL